MKTYDVRVNIGGVVNYKINANTKDEAIDIVMDKVNNLTINELNKEGTIIKDITKINEVKKSIGKER